MLPLVLIAIPLAGAAAAYLVSSNRVRPALLPLVTFAHLAATLYALSLPNPAVAEGWLTLDPLGRVILLTVSLLFSGCSLYAFPYLILHVTRSNRILCACLLSMLAAMSAVAHAQHVGFLWVSMEATALAGAPLIYFRRTPQAIEAMWKYLLLSSIGIALGLLGSFFLAYAAMAGGQEASLFFPDLIANAPGFSQPWLRAAFVVLLIGYGTKMGLAPMHTWKPDAYGEAPGIVGAVLAGGLTSCAFLAIVRFTMIMNAADQGAIASRFLLILGLMSMAVAAAFLTRQQDIKRMLAYSSIEHMGLLVIGLAMGGAGIYGAMLHVLNNALTKGLLFLAAGNLHRSFGSKSINEVRGAFRRAPRSAVLFFVGFLAIVGSPPFGPFLSLFSILQGIFATHHFAIGACVVLLLWTIFISMGHTVLRVLQGGAASAPAVDERNALITPVALLAIVVLLLGVWLPEPLSRLIHEAAAFVEGRS
ncbi:MAG: hydrogenase [Candidatus Hydrogenedentes bacterium]|nr:hydrogenase [Candidatus Hydrogenedentota bacterium]